MKLSLNDTPKGERIQIALFGRRNAGKSSLINAITEQNLAIVSDVKGTTTDPVYKAMELLPLGPVMIVDTPGLDDVGTLGAERIKRAYDVLNKTDMVLIVVDGSRVGEHSYTMKGVFTFENELLSIVKKKNLPYLFVLNKQDKWSTQENDVSQFGGICVSATTGYQIHELKELIAKMVLSSANAKSMISSKRLVGDLLSPGDFVVLVVPIDESAPKGRLILPQQQTIRDILESDAIAIVIKDNELKNTLTFLGKKPKLVITDSQAFAKVSAETPEDIALTSFSILFARYKGDLPLLMNGIEKINNLKDGDTILIAEGCTHHRQCNDIGTVKIPNWIKSYTGTTVNFETCSGGTFPDKLDKYNLIIHCGACTLNQREMSYRLATAKEQGIPIINYGILIAYINGILARCIEPFE